MEDINKDLIKIEVEVGKEVDGLEKVVVEVVEREVREVDIIIKMEIMVVDMVDMVDKVVIKN